MYCPNDITFGILKSLESHDFHSGMTPTLRIPWNVPWGTVQILTYCYKSDDGLLHCVMSDMVLLDVRTLVACSKLV